MKYCYALCLLLGFLFTLPTGARAQEATTEHTVARRWNEQNLEAIRNDFARPTVHARNLYHVAAAMYDCWSLINRSGSPALMRTVQGDFSLDIATEQVPDYPDKAAASEAAISYAAYRILVARYVDSPGANETIPALNALMDSLGYSILNNSTDYRNGDPASLGNYVAATILAYGRQDGANEVRRYANVDYPEPFNPPLVLDRPFSIFNLVDPNRWQSFVFPGAVVDQSGNILDGNSPVFLGAQWGRVQPFALSAEDRTDPDTLNPILGNSPIYHDPGPPPYYNFPADTMGTDLYRWNFELVLKWSSHLDPADSVMWDIGPGARGNTPMPYPTELEDHRAWYDVEGGQPGRGRELNPVTGQPYAPNIVPRGDYTRVLAEFWADGPDSETPPGHWFSIFNEKVLDHPLLERRIGGAGPELDPLEYDVKAYLALGGAMHDAAVTAWSIKGAYDYTRPISAIRYLAARGQACDPEGRFYNAGGIRCDPGYIEQIGNSNEIVNSVLLATVKARAWVGNTFIENPDTDQAGVDWMNPSLWEPYQRPNFVTPNFAGYVSGHSTFSSAAATVLSNLTGSEYFPGGLAEFVAKKNEFLVFEEGPSQDVVLQWATYRDASDETSLSRIWGGIHPPADDIPGRIIGIEVGTDAYAKAEQLFAGNVSSLTNRGADAGGEVWVYPNPVPAGYPLTVRLSTTAAQIAADEVQVLDAQGREIRRISTQAQQFNLPTNNLPPGIYAIRGLRSGWVRLIQVR